jgi:hypothetical protein
MNKFTTIKASLFTNTNDDNLPEWMKNVDFGNGEKKKLDIDFENKKAWTLSASVNRDDRDYSAKEVTAKLNDNEVLLSKIELSKFLKGMYYEVKNATVNNNNVILHTAISNTPGEFNFIYTIDNNKIKSNNVFTHNENEYPFSNAGLEECIADAKSNKTVVATKVQNNGASIISREEIFRRFNGHIRKATDRINELLKEGSIIGVTSNSYGTFLDVDYLFPQMEREKLAEKAPEFEFVKNMEKVATSEHKSAYQLAMEASKQFESNFDDFKICAYERNGDKLSIIAEVLNNNVSSIETFMADIKNEKVGNINFNVKNSNKKIATAKQNRLSDKNIISKSYVKDLIKNNGFFNVNVNDIFDDMVRNHLITAVSEDKYTSAQSLGTVLQYIERYLPNKDMAKYSLLVDKVDNIKLSKIKTADTGVRENIISSDEQRFVELNNSLSRKFAGYYIKDFTRKDNDNYTANVIFTDSGVKNKLKINAKYNGTKVVDITANIKGRHIPLEKTASLFKKTAALSQYVLNNQGNNFTDKIVLTTNQIIQKLSNFVDIFTINKIMNDWVANEYLVNIGGNMYVSNHTFEELLNLYDVNILSEEEINSLIDLKSYFGEGLEVVRNNVTDTGVREDIKHSKEYRLVTLNNYLSQKFVKFYIRNFEMINEDVYEADVIFVNNGLKNKLHVCITYNGNRIGKVEAVFKSGKLPLSEAITLFKTKPALSIYLNDNQQNVYTDKIVMTINQIYNKLAMIFSEEEIANIIDAWIANSYIVNIGGETYVSDYTFEELLTMLDNAVLSNEEVNRLITLKSYFGEKQTFKREAMEDTGVREPSEYVSNQTLIKSVNEFLSKYFNSFEIEEINTSSITTEDTCSAISYVVRVFNEDNGLSLRISLQFTFENNTIKDCVCNVNGENISIDELEKVFVVNESLNKYLTMFNGKKVKSSIIVTKNSLKERLSKVANVTDESLEDTLDLLVKTDKLKRIASNMYASDYSLEELINLSNLKPLSDEEFLYKIQKAQNNKLMKLSKNYINDNDTRMMVDTWSADRIRTHICSKLNKYFKNYDVMNFDYNNNKYIVAVNATDKDGINKSMMCYFDVDKNHPNDIVEITNLDNESVELSEFLANNTPNVYNDKGVITRNQLQDNLIYIIDVNDLDDIIVDLFNDDLLIPIENDKYAMNCTMSDIVGYLSKNKKTNLVEGKKNKLNGINKRNAIDTEIKHDIETDTRNIEQEEKLSFAGEKSKDRLMTLAKDMYKNKKITLNKLNSITTQLNSAKNERELNVVNNELNKYLR